MSKSQPDHRNHTFQATHVSSEGEGERQRESSATMSSYFKEIQVPQQKHYNSIPFPAVLAPGLSLSSPLTLSHLTESIGKEKEYLESLLHKSGSLIIRGFPVNSASDFNDVLDAFGFEEMPWAGGRAPRTNVVGRVSTNNESPPMKMIPFHHEMAQLPQFPSKLFFCCDVEPASGGETAIALSHIIYERMKEKYPDFVQRLEEHGLMFVRVLADEDDHLTLKGSGWKTLFRTDDKVEAEKRAAELGTKLEWFEGGVKQIIGPLQAIKYDKSRNRKIWFNKMAFAACKDMTTELMTFGDGKPFPDEIIQDLANILEEEKVAVPWKKGDVLIVDNLAALHARMACNSTRRILVSLCK